MKTKYFVFIGLLAFMLTGCNVSYEQAAPPAEVITESTEAPDSISRNKFKVSAELEAFTSKLNRIYFDKYGRDLISDKKWWLDYGIKSESGSGLISHEYVYWENIQSYLDPNITVVMDEKSGSIISVDVSLSHESFSERTNSIFKEYFYCIAAALIPDMDEIRSDKLLSDLQNSQVYIEIEAEISPSTVYYTDEIFCFSYFHNGHESVYFGTDVEKLPEYMKNNVRLEVLQ